MSGNGTEGLAGAASKFGYIAFRLAPMLLVMFFMLTSLINVDMKGITYAIGLVLACLAASYSGGQSKMRTDDAERHDVCDTFTLGSDRSVASVVPLGIVVYAYTFFYMLIFIANLGNTTNNRGILDLKHVNSATQRAMFAQNVPVLIMFPLLIFCEAAWLSLHNCIPSTAPLTMVSAGVFVGGLAGVLWAVCVTATGKIELQYVNKYGLEVCNRPRKTMMKCKKRTTEADADTTVTDTAATDSTVTDAANASATAT
jgi:hypothetical protein